MNKDSKGAALTGVILMVLVMTLIGVPLLGMVVYNYRFIELSNSLKRSEYENEVAMDIISRIIRQTVIDAITEAKKLASENVNEIAELQRTNYASSTGKYESLWINQYNLWANGNNEPDNSILGDFLYEIKDDADTDVDSELRTWWNNLTEDERNDYINNAKKAYIDNSVENEFINIDGPHLTAEENDSVDMLLNEDGMIDEEKLNDAYNIVFKTRYHNYLKENIPGNILAATKYTSIIDDESKIDVSGLNTVPTLENYLKINKPKVRTDDIIGNNLEIDVGTRFKKNKTTPSATLSATFVIKSPEFDSVASVTQQSIMLSNALLNQGGVIVGGQLNLAANTHVQIASDLTVLGDGDGEDTAILLNKNSSLKATNSTGHSFNVRMATPKDILLDGGSTFITGNNPIYYRNLYVGKNATDLGKIIVKFNGDAVAEDDLEIDHEGEVEITQKASANYYGFNDTNNQGPDSSSSIVINSDEIDNKTMTLGNLYLAGRAFIDGVEGTEYIPMTDSEGNILKDAGGNIIYADTTYKTGESLAIKGNYIAYQTLFYGKNYGTELGVKTIFSPVDNIKLGKYRISGNNATEMKYSYIDLVDNFKIKPPLTDFSGTFDVNGKWKYFRDFANFTEYQDILKSIKVISNIKYIEGTAFDSDGKVVASSNETISDTSFRNNLSDEYEKYAKYFGYMPADESLLKTEVFGANGWVKNFANSRKITADGYHQIYSNGDMTGVNSLNLSGDANNGIIVCKGDLNIKVPTGSSATFKGVIIVGGDLTINGGTLIFANGKEQVIDTVISNYLGEGTDKTGEAGSLFETFTYDGSGSSYIVTNIGDGLVNINELIGITNWKKSSYGRL